MKFNIFLIFILALLSASVVTAEYDQHEVERIIFDAAREIEPGFSDRMWYVEDDMHLGLVSFSDYGPLEPKMQNMEYWSMEERLSMYENPDYLVSSGIMFNAPSPCGHRVVVQVDGYNLLLADIQPVAENIFTNLVQESASNGVFSTGSDTERIQTDEYPKELITDDIEVSTPYYENGSSQEQIPEDIPVEEYDDMESEDPIFVENNAALTPLEELITIYDLLEGEELIDNLGEVDVGDIDKMDIEQYQLIHMNYIHSPDFVESIQDQAKIIGSIRDASSKDIDMLDGMDLKDDQDVDHNKDIIKEVFADGFIFGTGNHVEAGGQADYDGKENIADKLSDVMYLDAIDKTRQESIKKIKTGHEAASFFSDDYSNSQISKTFEKIDKLNSIKENVDKYVGAYKDYELISEMKGASGASAKALYIVSKSGQEVAGKVPVVGEFIKKELEIAEKIVMVIPELDNAIKDSGMRQGRITSGGIGTSTPNAFLSEYGKVTQTSSGPSYSMPYIDEHGQEHEVCPDFWIKVKTNGQTYYVPTDEWENPIGDVAIKDFGSSWKPWKWDNCQVVKRTDPKVSYNNGEEYDL